MAPPDGGAGCALAQTEGEKSSSQNQQTYLNWVGALSLLPPAYGVAFQSMIETSAVCLKADRQTKRFAALQAPSFSSRAFAMCLRRDQPGRILRMPVRRCRNPLRGSSVRIIRGRQPHPSACGAAPQSSIEPSAVCLKADRQTNGFAALAATFPKGEGKVTNVRLLAPSDEGAGCALAQTE